MILSTKNQIDSAMQQGYEGRAVELVTGYSHRSTLLKMRAVINEKVKMITGPLYRGEAEVTLLLPLCEAVRKATTNDGGAEVARHAYQLASAYALIFDISKISQSKEIANQITANSIIAQPIIRTFLRQAKLASFSNAEQNALKSAWLKVSDVLDKGIQFDQPQNDVTKISPLYLLYAATVPNFSEEDMKAESVEVWNSLLGSLRHGKGTPLDRLGRRTMMGILTELLIRIDMLIEKAKVNPQALEIPNQKPSTAFIDAYTAMYWLMIYLEAIEQYDLIFPASDLMVQSQAWVLAIKTQSAKLRKLFVDIAQVAAAFDVFTAMALWKEVRSFYGPVLNSSLSAVTDMDALWSESEQNAERMLSSFASKQVKDTLEALKNYLRAEFLLPSSDYKVALSIADQYEEPLPNDEGHYIAKSGQELIINLNSVGERVVSTIDRDLLIPQLASTAGAIESTLSYLKRAREILQLSEATEDIYHSLLPEGLVWNNPYALTGDITQLSPAPFRFCDPMQLSYEKYDVSSKQTADNKGTTITSLDWKFTDLVMKPFYRIPQMQAFAKGRTEESRMLWEGMGDLPVGDVITAEYVAQPIPACYTASRNSNFVNNDFSAYLTLMSGQSGITASSRDMFRKIAAILERYPDTYGRGILDALSAVMFVYRTDPQKGSEWRKPTTPTIYGMPLMLMYAANKVDPDKAADEGVTRRSLTFSIDGGISYTFVLHKQMPKPGPMIYVAYPYAKGVYLQIPLLKDVFDTNRSQLEDSWHLKFNSDDNPVLGSVATTIEDIVESIRSIKDKKSTSFIPTLGWAPYLINLPHLLCSYQDKESSFLEEEYRKYAILSVRVRYDAVERLIYVGGFEDNPVELLTLDDYYKAVAETDPSPEPRSSTREADDTQPDVTEPTRSEKEEKPDPSTNGAPAKSEDGRPDDNANMARVGSVTAAPVVAGAEVVVPPTSVNDNPVSTKTPDPIAGTPGGAENSASKGDEAEEETTKYWKKIDASGNLEDVVKTETCPAGYVPASEEEYRTFVQKKASEKVESKED